MGPIRPSTVRQSLTQSDKDRFRKSLPEKIDYDNRELIAKTYGLSLHGFARKLGYTSGSGLARKNLEAGGPQKKYVKFVMNNPPPRFYLGAIPSNYMPRSFTFENREDVAAVYGMNPTEFSGAIGLGSHASITREHITREGVQRKYLRYVQNNPPPKRYEGPLSPESISTLSSSLPGTTQGETLNNPLSETIRNLRPSSATPVHDQTLNYQIGQTMPNPQSLRQTSLTQHPPTSATSPIVLSSGGNSPKGASPVTSPVGLPFSDKEFGDIFGTNSRPSPRSSEGANSPTPAHHSPAGSHHSFGSEWEEIGFVSRTPSPVIPPSGVTSPVSRSSSPAASENEYEVEEVVAASHLKLEHMTPSFAREIGYTRGLSWEDAKDVKLFQDEYLNHTELPPKDLENIKQLHGELSPAVKQLLFTHASKEFRVENGKFKSMKHVDW